MMRIGQSSYGWRGTDDPNVVRTMGWESTRIPKDPISCHYIRVRIVKIRVTLTLGDGLEMPLVPFAMIQSYNQGLDGRYEMTLVNMPINWFSRLCSLISLTKVALNPYVFHLTVHLWIILSGY